MNQESRVKFYFNHLFHSDLFSGITSGLYALTSILIAAALIFKGNLSTYISLGIFTALIGMTVTTLVVSMKSYCPWAISYPPAALASLIALIVASIGLKTPEAQLAPTIIAAMGLGSLLVGLVLFVLGYFELTYVFRFIPYPVMGGFIAGVGGTLITGALSLVDENYKDIFLGHENSVSILMSCLLTTAMGIFLFLLNKYFRHSLTNPLAIAVGIILTNLFWHSEFTLSPETTKNLTLPSAEISQHWHLLTWNYFSLIDWKTISNQVEAYLVLVFISIIFHFFNLTSLEISIDKSLRINHEVKVEGIANLSGGFVGAMLSTMSFTGTDLNYKGGGKTRYSGIIACLLCIGFLLVFPNLITYIPKFILAGLIFAQGLMLLDTWLYQSYFQLKRSDYFIILIIFFAEVFLGFLPGIIIGIIITCAQFIYQSSRTSLVKYILNGKNHQGIVKYSYEKESFLQLHGESYYIFKLQGSLFFGNTSILFNKINRLIKTKLDKIRYLILDFQFVLGLDSSAYYSFASLKRLIDDRKIELIFSHCHPGYIKQFKKNKLTLKNGEGIKFFPTLNEAVEWCEKQILKSFIASTKTSSEDKIGSFRLPKSQMEIFKTYLNRIEFKANEIIFAQGDPSDTLYFIQTGTVAASIETKEGELKLYIAESGTVIGEMGFYLNSPRSAKITAEMPCLAYQLTREAFEKLKKEEPEITMLLYHYVVCVLSTRLSITDKEISQFHMDEEILI